jgi:5,10-methylenetetrahydromethanopterin reductase
MDYSCGLAPAQDTPELAELIEELGFSRLWLYDSPCLHADLWITLARAAERTSTIGLGPGILVPSLRHVVVTASALATMEQLAPGRNAVAVGPGFSARLLLGQRPMRWTDVEAYVRQLKGLLRGEEVEVDGHLTQLVHPTGYVADRPLDVPVVIAASGPKGLRVAQELGDGVMSVKEPVPGFDWSIAAGSGTVLQDGESYGSPRVLEAVGPYLAMLYHYFYEAPGVDVAAFPGGEAWKAEVEAIPLDVRHLRLHEHHMVGVPERDRAVVTGEAVQAMTWTGTPEEMRARFDEFERAGVTEVYYEPVGPDLRGEIIAFAEAVGIGDRAALA